VKNVDKLAVGGLLAWTASLTTLIVMPSSAFDPINVPKLLVIAIGGFIALGALIIQIKFCLAREYRSIQLFAFAFILDLLVVLIISGTNFSQEFFGTFGRATGFVAYISLTFLLVAAVFVADTSLLSKIKLALLISGAFSNLYGVLQIVDADPFNWVSAYNPVIGFLGNPNFQSSFLGFNAVLVFALLLNKRNKLSIQVLLLIDLIVSIYVIKSTDSQQGLLVVLGGVAVVSLIWVNKSKLKFLTIPALITSVFAGLLVALGSINSGPLAGLLYKSSVTYRGDYWRAGWEMTLAHPFFGVGLDSYGDWYQRARTEEATLRRGPEVVSNAAHNVLLDLSSNGGFPLLVIYLFLMGLVFVSSIKVIRRIENFNPIFSGLFAVWICYQAQSLISLNQLGLAVWGWIISGLLIGYEINTRGKDLAPSSTNKNLRSGTAIATSRQKIRANVLVGMFLGGLVGSAVGLPPVIASTKFLAAIKSQDPLKIQAAAYISPLDANNMYVVTNILASNKYMAEALDVSNDSIAKFKDSYSIWAVRSTIEGLAETEKKEAIAQMKRLDPHNPNLK
jgi:O-antigen ligase